MTRTVEFYSIDELVSDAERILCTKPGLREVRTTEVREFLLDSSNVEVFRHRFGALYARKADAQMLAHEYQEAHPLSAVITGEQFEDLLSRLAVAADPNAADDHSRGIAYGEQVQLDIVEDWAKEVGLR